MKNVAGCIWKVFQQDRQALDHFCCQGGHTGRSDRLAFGVTGPGGLTALGTRSDRPGQWMIELLLFGLHWFRGSLHLLRGSFHVLACVQGELLWFIALVVVLFVYRWRGAFLAAPVRSRYELCSQVILFLSCVGTFDHLWSLCCFVVDFSFIFHMVTMCVVNALIKGEIEDQERPRTNVVAP